MALCMTAALSSCGGSGNNGGNNDGNGGDTAATNINVLIFTGTATRNGAIKWIQDAAARFTELKKDESYESGKNGVNITIQDNKLSLTTASARTVTIFISMKLKLICTLTLRLTSLCSSTKS